MSRPYCLYTTISSLKLFSFPPPTPSLPSLAHVLSLVLHSLLFVVTCKQMLPLYLCSLILHFPPPSFFLSSLFFTPSLPLLCPLILVTVSYAVISHSCFLLHFIFSSFPSFSLFPYFLPFSSLIPCTIITFSFLVYYLQAAISPLLSAYFFFRFFLTRHTWLIFSPATFLINCVTCSYCVICPVVTYLHVWVYLLLICGCINE